MKEAQDNEDDSDNDQGMDPIAGTRDPRADIAAKKAEQPQD